MLLPKLLTLIEKIWLEHVVADLGDGLFLLRIDRLVLHERGGGIALSGLSEAGLRVRSPQSVFATIDHVVDTMPNRTDVPRAPGGHAFIRRLREQTATHGLRLFDLDDPRQGIVHVISPALGIALPGTTLACNDSHTSTVGGIGALGFGIGSQDMEHALATGTLVLEKPRAMRVTIEGPLAPGVGAKDVILHLIGQLGTAGAAGFAVELAGSAVQAMSVEARLTLCNMTSELGARSACVAPDDTTFAFLAGAEFAPRGHDWERALAHWRTLASDEDASPDQSVSLDASRLGPQITWGTSPEHVVSIDQAVPHADTGHARAALEYMGLDSGARLEGLPIDAAFIGSCTNGRLPDLREAATQLRGRRIAVGVRALCVPGSGEVKRAAEAEGLDRVFRDAGFEWREPGCSLCFHAGGEGFREHERVVTTTNRNFEGRQGPGVRSHLASPATVAASAVAGCIADVRKVEARA